MCYEAWSLVLGRYFSRDQFSNISGPGVNLEASSTPFFENILSQIYGLIWIAKTYQPKRSDLVWN